MTEQTPHTAEEFRAARRDSNRVKQVHVIGTRPVRRRPVTNFLKLSFFAGTLWVGGKLLSSWSADPSALEMASTQATADKSVASSIAQPHGKSSAQVASRPAKATVENADFSNVQSGVVDVNKPRVLASISTHPGDTHNDIVRKYQATGMRSFETAFEALSVQAEGIELKPYNAGESKAADNITIGIGYHIPSNLRQLGRAKVLDELTAAGISQSIAEDLVSQDPKRLARVEITPNQGLSLLAVTMPRYKQAVINRLGERNWRNLGQIAGPEGQAGVVWSAYNGAFWQHADETVAAIRSGDRLAVAQSIGGTARINGKSQENHNLSLARAAVASRDTFNYAVGYGNRAGADQRVNNLVARAAPVAAPATPSRPAPDMVAQGQMMAVEVQPEPQIQLVDPNDPRPYKSRLNVEQFQGSPTPSQAPSPSQYRP